MYSSNISSTDDILRGRFLFTGLPAYIAGLFETPPAKSVTLFCDLAVVQECSETTNRRIASSAISEERDVD